MPTPPDQSPADGIGFSGIALQAQDTGRVLLLQRSLADEADPNAGLWEFPGGALEPGEDPYEGACREFGEEVGVPVPDDAENAGTSWDLPSEDPKYRLHLLTVPSESSIDMNSNEVQNPDDPNGLNRESLAFWDPAHIQGEHIRPEVQDTMKTVGETLTTPKDVVAATPPAPPFTKKTSSPAADPEEASEQKVLDILAKAADLAETPELKALINEAEAALKPQDAVVAAVPPHPGLPDATGDGTQPTELETAGKALEQAKGLIQGHIDGSIPDNSASLQTLLDLITQACDILVPPSGPATEFDALIASAAPVAPPDEWFDAFDLDGPTPLTVTAEGRVFGHLATWGSCHVGGQYANKCVPPPSDPQAPYFHLGSVLTANGNEKDVGVITVGGGHFTASGMITSLEHHDDVTAQAALVVVKEDEHGIGVFGSVTPEATPSMVASLRRSPISGAWTTKKGRKRLVGIHAVNTPGFPTPRTLVASAEDSENFYIVGRVEPKEPVPDLRQVAQRLAKAAGLDTESLVASARAAMADLDCDCEDEVIVASLSGDTSLPVSSYDLAWDGGAATDRVFTWANGDVSKIGKAFLWRNEQYAADIKAGWNLPFADIVDGTLKIVPRGVQATAGGHGIGQLDGISDADRNAIKAKIGELYRVVQAANPEAPSNPFESQ